MNYLEEMMSDEMIYGVKVKDRSAEHKRPQVILSYIETVEDKVIGHFMTITDDLYSNDKSKVFSKGNDHFTHRYMNENEDVVPWMHKEGYMLVDKDKWSNYYMCVHGFGDFNQAVSEINAKSKIYKERINSNKSKKNTNVTTVDKSGFASKTNTIQFADSNMNHIARLAKTSNDYRNFMELYRRFEDVGFTNVYHAVTGSGSITAADAEIIRSGKLKCSADDVKRATSVLTYELKFKNIVSEVGGRGDYFKIALAFCFNHPEIDNEFLLKRLRKNYGKMTKIKSIRDALLQIEKIYNYRRNPKVSIEHDYLRRNSAK